MSAQTIQLHQPQSLSLINDEKKMQLLKDVFFKTATQDEFQLFAHACDRSGLDPFMKQIYPVKRWDSTLKREAMTIQTGIDGYRLIAERTGCYSPGREPTFAYNKDGRILSATAYVKKLTKDGTWHEISATAFFDEYCQTTKEGLPVSMWKKMPHSQLAKCAEALVLRKGFPAELSGLYTKEEMEQSEVIDVPTVAEIKKTTVISSAQSEDLKLLFAQCDPEYEKVVLKSLKIKNVEEIQEQYFERIKNAAINKSKEQKAQLLSKSQEFDDSEYEASDV